MKTPQGMVYEGDFEDGLPHGKVGAVVVVDPDVTAFNYVSLR